jgi:hypothetical protein
MVHTGKKGIISLSLLAVCLIIFSARAILDRTFSGLEKSNTAVTSLCCISSGISPINNFGQPSGKVLKSTFEGRTFFHNQ